MGLSPNRPLRSRTWLPSFGSAWSVRASVVRNSLTRWPRRDGAIRRSIIRRNTCVSVEVQSNCVARRCSRITIASRLGADHQLTRFQSLPDHHGPNNQGGLAEFRVGPKSEELNVSKIWSALLHYADLDDARAYFSERPTGDISCQRRRRTRAAWATASEADSLTAMRRA